MTPFPTLQAALLALSLAALVPQTPTPIPKPGPTPSPKPSEDPPKPDAAAKLVLIPGTRVYVAPPEGHSPGRGYLGFTWADSGSSLAVKELRGGYVETVKQMNAEELLKNGMTVLSTAEVEISGHPARLCHVSQKQRDITVRKWLAATGDDKRTLLLTAVYVDVLDNKLSEPMKNAILGAVWDPKLDIDPFVLLPWSIEKPAGLRFADESAMKLTFTEDGDYPTDDEPAAARLAVGPVMGEIKFDELKSATEERARQLPNVGASLAIESSTALEAGGRKGWEVVGKAHDEQGNADVLVYVAVLTGPADHMLFTGQCGLDGRENWLPALRTSAKSWKVKAKPAEDKPAPK